MPWGGEGREAEGKLHRACLGLLLALNVQLEPEPFISEAVLGKGHVFRDFTRGWVSPTTGTRNDRGVHLEALEAGSRRWRCWQGWLLRLRFHHFLFSQPSHHPLSCVSLLFILIGNPSPPCTTSLTPWQPQGPCLQMQSLLDTPGVGLWGMSQRLVGA